jgi:hypothetical protein
MSTISCSKCRKTFEIGTKKALDEMYNKTKNKHGYHDPTAYNKYCRECGKDYRIGIWGENEEDDYQRQKYQTGNEDFVVDDDESISKEESESYETDTSGEETEESSLQTEPSENLSIPAYDIVKDQSEPVKIIKEQNGEFLVKFDESGEEEWHTEEMVKRWLPVKYMLFKNSP